MKKTVHLKTPQEALLIQESASIVEASIALAAQHIKIGVTTLQLNAIIDEFIASQQAKPSFKGYGANKYPFAACISVNNAVVHGFPNDIPLKDGDILSIDVGAYKNGFHGDSAYTFAVGNVAPEVLQLMRVTKESLYAGIQKAIANNRLGDIGYAIEQHCKKPYNYGVVDELVGHGLGRNLHEEPQVPNKGRRGEGKKMQEGLVIAIEPMINLGTKNVTTADDGWTILTADGKQSAHYEHNVYIQKNQAKILSSFIKIEAVEIASEHLNANYL